MPEYLRALIVVMALALPVLWIAQSSACEMSIDAADYKRRRNLWIVLTVLAFVAHNFWIYIGVAALLLWIAGASDSHRLGLYIFLLFVVPPFQEEISGFGVINFLIAVDHLRLLSLVVLLPAWLTLRSREGTLPFGRTLADKCLLGYVALQLALQWNVDTATNTARYGFYTITDIFLPYYVASRSLRDLRSCRDALMSFLVAALVMTPIAAFEYAKYWLLYSTVPGELGVRFGMGNYLGRGDSLRALASTGHSIVLGYLMAIALSLYAITRWVVSHRGMRLLGGVMLCIGLFAPVSRGPWVGAAAGIAVLLLTGPDKMARAARLLMVGVPLIAIVLVSPMGGKLIDLLPFVGTVDEFNVTYRQRLFEVSLIVLKNNLLLGSFDYLQAPAMQEMIQGEGIIDMVNSYLGIALAYGVVGLTLFAGVFLSAGWSAWRAIRSYSPLDEISGIGQALLAALVCALVTIGTVSSILVIPTVYWLIAGLCVGYANYARTAHVQELQEIEPDPVRRPMRAPPRQRPGGAWRST